MSEKTCCVIYRPCDQEGYQNIQECNVDFPYMINLDISGDSGQVYCYTVTASSDTYTVKVNGTFTSGKITVVTYDVK